MSGDDRPSNLVDAGFPHLVAEDLIAVESQMSAALVEVVPAGWVVRFDPDRRPPPLS